MEYIHKTSMSQSEMFYETVLRPYIEPFYDLTHQTMGKLIAGGVYAFFMVMSFTVELFSTPELWWKGLAMLVILDFIAGNLRVLTDHRIKFDIKKWGRTAYKIPSYIIAGLAVGAGANMLPSVLGWIQYVTYAVLSGMEIWSILRNLKLFALMSVLWKLGQEKLNIDGFEDLRRKVDDESFQSYQEHVENVYNKSSSRDRS